MTRDEIISMAREAGAVVGVKSAFVVSGDGLVFVPEELERFAALVAAKEREACAQACERLAEDFAQLAQTAEVDEADRHGYSRADSAAMGCAAAIRTRSQA